MTMTVLALLIALAVVTASIALTRGTSALRRNAGGPAQATDLMEIAFLNGGPSRTVDTALTTMYSDGRLAIGGPGVASARSTVAHHPVERAVLTELAAAPNGALHTLRHAVMRSAAVQEIGDSLAFRGLMVPPQAGRKLRIGSIILLLACVLGLPVAIVTSATVAFAGGSPGLFISLVLPALMLGIVCGAVNAGRAAARVTPAGRAAAAAYAISHADWTGPGHLVAVHGLRALPDPVLQDQLRTAARLTPGISRTTTRTPSPGSDNNTLYATALVWCAGSTSGQGSCGSSSVGSGSGSGGGGCSGGSGGSSCGGSSSSGSSCSSSSGSSCSSGSS